MQDKADQTPISPLSPEQTELLQRLAKTLTREQSLWISGYLAGAQGALQMPDSAASGAGEGPGLVILYGSESGNSQALAEQAGALAEEKGMPARVVDMADYRHRDLKNERLIMVITATHGEGDPPEPAEDFYSFLHGRKAPKLKDARFAVLSLGDSSYEHFCQTGKDFDARLEALGGQRLVERVDCDVDYDEPAAAWMEQALAAFAEHMEAEQAQPTAPTGAAATASAPRYDRRNPWQAEVLENLVLNGRGSDKETRHIELSLEDSGISFEPGDVLCLAPQNDPRFVDELLDALGLDAGETVGEGDEATTLGEALRRDYEITTVTPRFVEAYAPLTGSQELAELADPQNRKQLLAYTEGRWIVDLVRDYPPEHIDAARLVETLRPLPPREYSIASSYNANPDEVHVTVAALRFESDFGYREGVASCFLADRVEPGETVPVYIKRNKNFKLPDDPSTPLIMVGPGTGVAPFRAFLEEREYQAADGASWLFFGERRFRLDFLYQVEWQRWLREGVLTRMDVAFSRDGPDKVYVQHRLRENAGEIYRWLEDGAYFYVCGDAEYMAPDVHQALIDIVRGEGGLTDEQAREYVKQLQRDKRYQRDVY